MLEGNWDIRHRPERGKVASLREYCAYFTKQELTRAAGRVGVNSGSFAVRAGIFREVMAAWRKLDEGKRHRDTGFWDQASWNRLLLRDTEDAQGGGASCPAEGLGQDAPPPCHWIPESYPEGEIQFPMYLDMNFRKYSLAALTHNCGGNPLVKIEFTFGLYMRTFFSDPSGLFFSMLEV